MTPFDGLDGPLDPNEPRRQHYQFAHWMLPYLAAQHAAEFERMAARGVLGDALTRIWDKSGERLPVDDRVASIGLAAHYTEYPDYSIIVIVMPPARYQAEAYFIALVIEHGVLKHYLVLEHTTPDSSWVTALGEWTTDTHLNHGPGPEPDEDAFLAAVEARLRDVA